VAVSRFHPPAGIGIIGCGRAAEDLHLPAIARTEAATAGTALHGVALAAVRQVANAAGWVEAATSDGTQRVARQVSRRGTESCLTEIDRSRTVAA
jgi:hypothetical protein